jgi:hypothetical protein
MEIDEEEIFLELQSNRYGEKDYFSFVLSSLYTVLRSSLSWSAFPCDCRRRGV